MRRRDLWLILVAMAGIALGVGLPAVGLLIRPTVLYLMMTILFMSFLKIDLAGLARFGPGDAAAVVLWSGLKLIALPVVLWALARWLLPGYALAVLLLTATSTGVTAPFFAVLLGANTVRVLQLVVVTSLLVPLTLPALVRLLMGAEVAIGFMPMARMLLLIIVVPFALSLATRRWLPALARAIDRVQYPLSLTLFFLINWGSSPPTAGSWWATAGTWRWRWGWPASWPASTARRAAWPASWPAAARTPSPAG